MRGTPKEEIRRRIVKSDEGASYFATFEFDLDAIEPMVASPGDPRNGVPVTAVVDRAVKIDIAYGGSCTGGKRADMDMYASVLAPAAAKGQRVADGVHLYIQLGSQRIRDYAEAKGYLDVFRKVGAEIVEPSCGACIKAGPGVSDKPGQVTVSAINRNFPGRSGPGDVWLASPMVVAASALAGKLVAP
jgi:3-isopropylmalate/(R)-2-methylmalate dehydratase large subunit